MTPVKTAPTNPSPQLASDAAQGSTFFTPVKPVQWPGLDRWLAYLIMACGVATMAVGIYLSVSSWSPVPLWDEWQELDIVSQAPNHVPPLPWLWSQHSEHRTLVYRLLLLADVHFFHGTRWIEYASIVAVLCGFLGLLIWLIRREGVRGALFWTAIGLAAFCVFCPSQWENLFWAIQIVVYLPGFFFLVALLALLQYQRSLEAPPESWGYLVLSIVAASAATYSFGNGVVAWPLLCAVTVVMGLRLRVVLLYVASSILLVGSYLFHYVQPNPDLSPWRSIRHPFALLEYVATMMGVALPPWMHIRDLVALCTGAFGLIAAIAMTIWCMRRDRRRNPLLVTLLGVMYYALVTAFVGGLSRAPFGADQALTSRYQTYTLLFWFSLITLSLLAVDRMLPYLRTIILLTVSVGMVTAGIVLFPLCLRAAHIMARRSEAAALTVVTGVPDKQALALLNPDTSVPWRVSDYFRQDHLFMFSGSWYGHMGEPLASVYRVVPQEHCAGQVDKVEPLPVDDSVTGLDTGGLRISGWAVNQLSGNPARSVVVAADGKIAGYGVGSLLSKTSGSKTFLKQEKFVQWWGFARPPSGTTHLDFYAAVDGRDEVCPLTTVDLRTR